MGLFGTDTIVLECGQRIPDWDLHDFNANNYKGAKATFDVISGTFTSTSNSDYMIGTACMTITTMPRDGTITHTYFSYFQGLVSGTFTSIVTGTVSLYTYIYPIDATTGDVLAGTVLGSGSYDFSYIAGSTFSQSIDFSVADNIFIPLGSNVSLGSGARFAVVSGLDTTKLPSLTLNTGTCSFQGFKAMNHLCLDASITTVGICGPINNKANSYSCVLSKTQPSGGTISVSYLNNNRSPNSAYHNCIPIAIDTTGGTIPFSEFGGLVNVLDGFEDYWYISDPGFFRGNAITLPYSARVSQMAFHVCSRVLPTAATSSYYATIYEGTSTSALTTVKLPQNKCRFFNSGFGWTIIDFPNSVILKRNQLYHFGVERDTASSGMDFGDGMTSTYNLGGGSFDNYYLFDTSSTTADLIYVDSWGTKCRACTKENTTAAWVYDNNNRYNVKLLIDGILFPDSVSTFNT